MSSVGWPSDIRNRRTRDREHGQIIVIFVLAAVALVLVAGLAVDAGNAFLNRRDGQNASDLAALSGTKIIADYYTKAPSLTSADVYTAIAARVAANGCDGGGGVPCSWSASFVDKDENVTGAVTESGSIPSGTQGVIVHVSRQPPTYFLGIIGQREWAVSTDATALTAKLSNPPPSELLPIAVNQPNFVAGQDYTITAGSTYGPGNFAWLSWTGQNATHVLVTSLCTPDNPAFTVPYWVPGDTGVTNSTDVRACLQMWIDSGATVMVPLFDQCNPCNGNNAQFEIVGFAAFVLTGYQTSGGAINTLTGYFVEYSPLTSVPAGSGEGPPSAGDASVSIGLVR